jgi:hypothetical protein
MVVMDIQERGLEKEVIVFWALGALEREAIFLHPNLVLEVVVVDRIRQATGNLAPLAVHHY